jgi:ubiquinone/menaquinone biosynthesis C-methylase UbiE
MMTETNDVLARDAYYSPTPMLVSDRAGRVRDVNLAFEVLLGRAALGCRTEPVERLVQSVSGRAQGSFIPPEAVPFGDPKRGAVAALPGESGGRGGAIRLQSSDHGTIELVGTTVRRIHPLSGEAIGMIHYWQIIDGPGFDGLRAAFLDRLTHQLTWEMYAVSYDHILPLMRYYQLVLRRHRKALAAPSIRRVADCGAGTGNLVELLLEDGKDVVAIDAGRAMLNRLRSKPWAETERLSVFQQSAEHLPNFEDSSFDGVNILLTLYDMENPGDGLVEAMRILRPGGRIVVTEPKRSFDMQVILNRCVVRLRRMGKYDALATDMDRVVRANTTLDPTHRPSGSPMRIEDVWETLRATGFQDLSMRDSHYRQCATVVGTKPGR